MGVLRSDLIAHSQLTSANASVLFDGGDGNAGSTGLKTADSGNRYEIQSDKGELTIECWINCTSVSQTFDTIWATNNYGVSGNSANFYQHYDGIYFTCTGIAADLDIRGLFEVNKWHHVATTRKWSPSKSTHQWRIYVDGEVVAHAETNSTIDQGVLCIGANNYGSAFPAYEFAGYISNFRMCRRELYKEKFTPSKFKLKNIPGTVLLCCQDASDDTAVTVGDTLTAGGSPTPGGFGPDLKEDITDTGPVFADNTKFDTLSYMVPPVGTTSESNRGRAVLAGGYTTVSPGNGTKTIEYLQIQSGGIVKDFGELSEDRKYSAGLASGTRGVIGGSDGSPSWATGTMEYVTIATTSNTTSFGNMTNTGGMVSAHSNNTRGLFFSVWDSSPTSSSHKRHIDYITIASAGNSTDFGELTVQRPEAAGFGSPTRGICAGGYAALSPFAASDVIDYVTIASTGDATDFGNLTLARQSSGGASSSTRGIIAGGYVGPNSYVDRIDYVTIASTGDAIDFGDTITGKHGMFSGNCSNQILGVWVGGTTANGTYTNTIEYTTIASAGNAKDFGDLTYATPYGSALTDCHGGIS